MERQYSFLAPAVNKSMHGIVCDVVGSRNVVCICSRLWLVFYCSPLGWWDNYVFNETINRSNKATCHDEERLILQKASRGEHLQERILSIGEKESTDHHCVAECQLSAMKAFKTCFLYL